MTKPSEPSDEGKGGPIEFGYVARPGLAPVPHRLLIGAVNEELMDACGVTDAEPEHLLAALLAMNQRDRLRILSDIPEYAENDPVVQGLRLQRLRAQDVLVPIMERQLTEARAELERYRKFACDVQERIDIDAPKLERLASIREALADFRLGAATPPSPPAAAATLIQDNGPINEAAVEAKPAEQPPPKNGGADALSTPGEAGAFEAKPFVPEYSYPPPGSGGPVIMTNFDDMPSIGTVEAKPAEGSEVERCDWVSGYGNRCAGKPGHFGPHNTCDAAAVAQEQPASLNRYEPNNGRCAYGACVYLPWRNGLCKDHWRAPPAGEQPASAKLGGPVVIDGWECVVTDDGVREASSVEGDDYVEGWPDRLCSFRPTTTRQHVRIPRAVAVWLLGLQEERGGNERG